MVKSYKKVNKSTIKIQREYLLCILDFWDHLHPPDAGFDAVNAYLSCPA
jgi:hypothetical protein